MKAPESLETLVEYGIIQEVVRPLMSGKEAQVYIVLAHGEECVAKVYKEAHQRTFKHRSDYTEGRKTRNTRDQRAMNKRSQHGRKKDEDAWRNTEVDMIYRLRDAGVRVPEPLNFVEGVLVMELVKDAEGHPAPRLGDLTFSASEASEIYQQLIREVVRMLCAGVVHGDLSDFNVLMGHDGPVVIDFPQAVDPTQNPNAEKLLLRDVENLHRFLSRFSPNEPIRPYGQEIWSLYQANKLEPETKLEGRHRASERKADTAELMELIEDANRDERRRRGERPEDEESDFEGPARAPVKASAPFRTVVDFTRENASPGSRKKSEPGARATRRARPARGAAREALPSGGGASRAVPKTDPARSGRRRRSGGKSTPEPLREARDGTGRSEAKTDDALKPPGARRRRRRRRSGTRTAGETKSEGASTGRNANARGDTNPDRHSDAGRAGKRPDTASPASDGTRSRRPDPATDRPRRRRRRAPKEPLPR